jgi:glycosyltransferase involved in cell wall biosynthesis
MTYKFNTILCDESIPISTTQEGISVVICCFNSEKRILPTLTHLAASKRLPDSLPIEVIIVDNGCDDDTVTASHTHWKNIGANYLLRICKESRPGQAFARIAGVKMANYSVIVFCDDDNWLSSDYLARSYQLMKNHSDAGIIGGKNTAVFESTPPEWFYSICGAYAIGGAMQTGRIDRNGAEVFGAGMVVRSTVFKTLFSLGYEPLNSGRVGRTATGGDDSELCLLARFMGFQIYEDASLELSHFMPTDRLTWQNALKLHRGFGASYKPFLAETIYRQKKQTLRTFVRCSGLYTFYCLFKYHFRTLFFSKHHTINPGDQKALAFEKAKGAVEKAFFDIPYFRRSITKRLRLLSSLDSHKHL